MLGKHVYHYQGIGSGDVTICPDCGFTFRNKIYGEQACGAICDPVWLDDEIPDMTNPTLRAAPTTLKNWATAAQVSSMV